MRLLRIGVRGFRNLQEAQIETARRFSVFHGENAQGKTNLIEAVHLLSNLQSFRTRRPRDLIEAGGENALLKGRVVGREGEVDLRVALDGQGRTAWVDDKVPESTAQYLAHFQTVLFSPADLDLARGSQDQRRRYLDRASFVRDASHLGALREYTRALRQRNFALRGDPSSLDVWDETLCGAAIRVRAARGATLAGVAPAVAAIHGDISGGNDEVRLAYDPSGPGDPGDLEAFREALAEARETDRRLGFTTVGPHRDALRVRIGGRPVESHASQGQLRTLALSLKLGLLLWGRDQLGEEPVFLLDDPGSELDSRRLGYLGDFLARWSGQVLVAVTDPEAVPLPRGEERADFRIQKGQILHEH